MAGGDIVFLNLPQARSGFLAGQRLPEAYVLGCRFFHCGIIDRTRSLDQGFAYSVLDPIPTPLGEPPSFGEICDSVGADIVAEAMESNKAVQVSWSGGIDSTCALIAIMKAVDAAHEPERLRVVLSEDSVKEYPRFYLDYVHQKYTLMPATYPISDFFDPRALNVTGEHGDQLFGSHLLKRYVRKGIGGRPYQEVVESVFIDRLGNGTDAARTMEYLEPAISAAPVPIVTLFDYMWWLNFSLKWQQVTLRLPALREDAPLVYGSLRHFFRGEGFQLWSLAHPEIRLPAKWVEYKRVAKQYILEFTGDEKYYRTKEKEDSLKRVMLQPELRALPRPRIHMRDDFSPVADSAA